MLPCIAKSEKTLSRTPVSWSMASVALPAHENKVPVLPKLDPHPFQCNPVNSVDGPFVTRICPVTVCKPQGPRMDKPFLAIVMPGIVPPDGRPRASQVPPVNGTAVMHATNLSPFVAPEKFVAYRTAELAPVAC